MAHNVQEGVNGMSLQGSKMSDTDKQNGHIANGMPKENGITSPPAMNGTHIETKEIVTKKTDLLNLDMLSSNQASQGTSETVSPPSGTDPKQEALTPDLVSQSSSVPSEQTASSGGALIDLEQSDIHEASTASLTPASPPTDGASGLDSFEPIQPSISQSTEACPPTDRMSLFGQTGQTLEELGVQEAPPPLDQTSSTKDNVCAEQNDAVAGASVPEPALKSTQKTEKALANGNEVPPPAVPKEAFTEASVGKTPPSPGSPSKIPKESKLPKKTPPASPKKKLSEAKPPEEKATPEPSGGARPKTAPPKVASPKLTPKSSRVKEVVPTKEEEARPQSAPSSKIPSPKKERTTLSTPKKQALAQRHRKQHGASDSGIEEDKGTPRSRTPASADKKKYGIDSKNTNYKPSGGNVKIFDKKLEVKVGSRIDSKPSPSKGGTPRTRPGGYVPPDMPQSKKLTETIKTMTPSPNTKEVSSKVGSLANTKHTPGGGNVRILTKKEDFSTVQSKCGSTANLKHTPGGGQKRIESQRLDWKAESRVGSLQNARHRPKGGDKKIETHKLEWNVTSRVGSMEKASHKPGGGDKKIETYKVDWNTDSKIGSLDNAKHTPGGGKKKIESQKLNWNVQSKVGSLDNATHVPGGGEKKIESQKLNWNVQSKVGSLDNATHVPGGGEKKIETHKIEFREKAAPKVGSTKNVKHQPGGGDKKIENHKVDFRDKAAPKIGSTANLDHQPGGGNKQIESHKLDFRDKAEARTKHGLSPAKVAEAAEAST